MTTTDNTPATEDPAPNAGEQDGHRPRGELIIGLDRDKSGNEPDSEHGDVNSEPDSIEKDGTISSRTEHGGTKGLEPTRYGDWEHNSRCTDF